MKIMVVTFNMAETCFEEQKDDPRTSLQMVNDLFQYDKVQHDIYVIGTQEAERSILLSVFNPSKDKLNGLVREYFNTPETTLFQDYDTQEQNLKKPTISTVNRHQDGKNKTEYCKNDHYVPNDDAFVVVHDVALGATSLTVLIRQKYVHLLTDIQSDTMAIGIMNMVANKTALNISFKLSGKKLMFINCHLEAHDQNRKERAIQWKDIFDKFIDNPIQGYGKISELDDMDHIFCDQDDPKFANETQTHKCKKGTGFKTLFDMDQTEGGITNSQISMEADINAQIDQYWDSIIWVGDFNSRIQIGDCQPYDKSQDQEKNHKQLEVY